MLAPQEVKALGRSQESPGTAKRQPALRRGRRHGDLPALRNRSDDGVVGYEEAVEEDLSEPFITVEATKPAHLDTFSCQGRHKVGEPPVTRRVGVGAEQAKAGVTKRRPRAPRLLPVEPPASIDALGAAAYGGEIGASAGLGPRLRPERLRSSHRRQNGVLLCLCPELKEGRREQEDTVLGDPLRPPCQIILFLKNQPLPNRRVAPSVSFWPADNGPPSRMQLALPLKVLCEPLLGVTAG